MPHLEYLDSPVAPSTTPGGARRNAAEYERKVAATQQERQLQDAARLRLHEARRRYGVRHAPIDPEDYR